MSERQRVSEAARHHRHASMGSPMTEGAIAVSRWSLSEEEFADQEIERGRRVHEHDGVLWSTVAGSYSRPIYEFRRIRPGDARPARWHSILGYSHQVPDQSLGTRSVGFMTIEADRLRSFGMGSLRSEKRAQVRKGLRDCEIREITDLDADVEEIRAVCVSQAIRHMGTGRFDRAPSYYTEEGDAWRASVEKCFRRKGWRWIGAYVNCRLVAYLTLLAVEDHAFFMAVKSHTESLRFCPSDALYFTALSEIKEASWCRRVVNGGEAHSSLNRFKAQFGFGLVEVPYYSPHAGLVRIAKKVYGRVDAARRIIVSRIEKERSEGGAATAPHEAPDAGPDRSGKEERP